MITWSASSALGCLARNFAEGPTLDLTEVERAIR